MTYLTPNVRVFITGTYSALNKGDAAIEISLMQAVKHRVPNVSFSLVTPFAEVDAQRYDKDVRIIQRMPLASVSPPVMLLCSLMSSLAGRRLRVLLHKVLKLSPTVWEYATADIVVDASGDTVTDDYGLPNALGHWYLLALAVMLGKPLVLYAQSIGPFSKTRLLYKPILNRARLITVRDEISYDYLKHKLGIKAPMFLTADSAFLLAPCPAVRAHELLLQEGSLRRARHPLVGINASQLVARWAFGTASSVSEKRDLYVRSIARIADYVVEQLNADVVLIPHVFIPQPEKDDRIACRRVYEECKHQERVKVLAAEYHPSELKGIIGQCDLFIGARMHSTIAAVSMHVPTIAIAYSHKAHGVIGRMVGLDDCIVDIREVSPEDLVSQLKSKIDYVWVNRTSLRLRLQERMPVIREKAALNAQLVAEIIESLHA